MPAGARWQLEVGIFCNGLELSRPRYHQKGALDGRPSLAIYLFLSGNGLDGRLHLSHAHGKTSPGFPWLDYRRGTGLFGRRSYIWVKKAKSHPRMVWISRNLAPVCPGRNILLLLGYLLLPLRLRGLMVGSILGS